MMIFIDYGRMAILKFTELGRGDIMQLISTSLLQGDMILAKDVYNGSVLYLKQGQANIARFKKNLHTIGIEYVYIEDRKSADIIMYERLLEDTRVYCEGILGERIEKMRQSTTLEIDPILTTVKEIILESIDCQEVLLYLSDICSSDDYTLTHSINTTIYSLLIAKELNYNRADLKELAVGTLLHDLGKVYLKRPILYKESALTLKEFEHVKTHSQMGANVLKHSRKVSEQAKMVALQHHERVDGSGYPENLVGEQIHMFARIAAIADVFDALTTDRCYRSKWSMEQAVSYLVEQSDSKFDGMLIEIFIQLFDRALQDSIKGSHRGIREELRMK